MFKMSTIVFPSFLIAACSASPEQMTQSNSPPEQIASIAQATYVDSSCSRDDFWIYDQPHQQGTRICIAGSGTFDLFDIMGNIKSFWAGSRKGILSSDAWDPPCIYGQGWEATWKGEITASAGRYALLRVQHGEDFSPINHL